MSDFCWKFVEFPSFFFVAKKVFFRIFQKQFDIFRKIRKNNFWPQKKRVTGGGGLNNFSKKIRYELSFDFDIQLLFTLNILGKKFQKMILRQIFEKGEWQENDKFCTSIIVGKHDCVIYMCKKTQLFVRKYFEFYSLTILNHY